MEKVVYKNHIFCAGGYQGVKERDIPAGKQHLNWNHYPGVTSIVLDQIKGVDIRVGLQRVQGDCHNYLALLHKFFLVSKTFPEKIWNALADDDRDEINHLISSLKTNAASICAYAVGYQIILLEDAVVKGDHRLEPVLVEILCATLSETRGSISPLLYSNKLSL